MCEWRSGEGKRTDNAETLSWLRFVEEEGFTTEDTEDTEKANVTNLDYVRLR